MKKPSDVNPITGVFACATIVAGAFLIHYSWATRVSSDSIGALVILSILMSLSTLVMSTMMSLLDGLIHYHLFALPKYKKYLKAEADKKSFLVFINKCRG